MDISHLWVKGLIALDMIWFEYEESHKKVPVLEIPESLGDAT
jgi:hypothetical protein